MIFPISAWNGGPLPSFSNIVAPPHASRASAARASRERERGEHTNFISTTLQRNRATEKGRGEVPSFLPSFLRPLNVLNKYDGLMRVGVEPRGCTGLGFQTAFSNLIERVRTKILRFGLL